MIELLSSVIEAHGGQKNWDRFSDFAADLGVNGILCDEMGWTGMVPESRLLFSLRKQRTVISLSGGQGTLLVQPDLVSHMDTHGLYRASLAHPREHLLRAERSDWDVLRTAYFFANIIRYSVTAPFLYALPGFLTEEIEPWTEGDETWRGLKIVFPREMEAPVQVQYAHYGSDGLLRRMRSRIDILENLELVSYITSYDQVNGIWIATCQDVFTCDNPRLKPKGPRIGEIRLSKYFLSERL